LPQAGNQRARHVNISRPAQARIDRIEQRLLLLPLRAARFAFAQVLPQLADITIYRWEYHFRASTVLGIVGAGGIGFELIAALRIIKYDQVSAILLTILMCVIMVDGVGAWLRRKLK